MSEDPVRGLSLPPFWSPRLEQKARRSPAPTQQATLEGVLRSLLGAVGSQVRSVPQLVSAFTRMLMPGDSDPSLQLPFDAPRSIMNGRVRGQRRVATQLFELARLKAVAKAAGCTLNDVVVAICGGALRRFLQDEDSLPEKPLTAGIPVSVRGADDEGTSTQVTFIIATLGTDVEDPLQRLETVAASTAAAKAHFRTLPRDAIIQYTMLLMAPNIVTMLTPLGGHTRPMFNVTVSNVPGPTKPLYFRGARMEASYPSSLITHSIGLDITCQSYADVLAFAFVGCRDTLPHLQNMAVYTAEAFGALEAALSVKATTGGVRKPVRKKRARKHAAPAARPRAVTRRRKAAKRSR